MATNIDLAKSDAAYLDTIGLGHPAYEKVALGGILHALLALHDQNDPSAVIPTTASTAPKRTTTKKADK